MSTEFMEEVERKLGSVNKDKIVNAVSGIPVPFSLDTLEKRYQRFYEKKLAPRQFLCNWGKSTQTLFCISIEPYFRLRKSFPRSSQKNKEKMVRPWVKVSLCQHQELKRLAKKRGKPLSEIIREAVCQFVRKKGFAVSTVASYLAKGTIDKYKAVSAYFPRSDWNLLQEISKNTTKCKTELIRQAVDEYLKK